MLCGLVDKLHTQCSVDLGGQATHTVVFAVWMKVWQATDNALNSVDICRHGELHTHNALSSVGVRLSC